jgi:hypothetical protein
MQNSGSNQSLYTHERFSYFEGFKLLWVFIIKLKHI